MNRHWLITAFDPFAGRGVNHSEIVLREFLARASNHSIEKWPFIFHSAVLPTQYDQCFEVLWQKILSLQEAGIELEGVLSMGEAKDDLFFETQANNLDHTPDAADNLGVIRVNQKIYVDRDSVIPFYFPMDRFLNTTAPDTSLLRSTNPGNFVCNHLCVRATVEFKKRFSPEKKPYFGFVHVPRQGAAAMFTPQKSAEVIEMGFKKYLGSPKSD